MANQEAQPVRSSSEMEAFYASLESETTLPPSHVVSLKTKPSEQTKKAVEVLQDLISNEFSLLFHPRRSILMKDTLKYLLTLPDEEFSITTKSELQWFLQRFNQLNSDYFYNCNADAKLPSETLELSKAVTVKVLDLEANVKKFREMDKEHKSLCNQLASLEEEQRELEEKINSIKIQIANSSARRDRVGKRKAELFQKGRVLKAQRDGLSIRVSRMKAEEELAKRTRVNIEAEWSKLREQFIRSTGFNEWI